VATFTSSYFQAHVVQHLLLMTLAPPLLALGAPSTLLLQTSSRATKKRWLGVLRSRSFAVMTHPVLVWALYFGAMFAFFLSSLVNFAMQHMALMDGINVAFLLGGSLYWWPMVGLDPIVHWNMGYGARIANLALGVPFESFLGIAIMSERNPVASMYTVGGTHSGGALLWAATELSTLAGLVPVTWQWMHAEERAAARSDARADRAEEAFRRIYKGQPHDGTIAQVTPPRPGASPLGQQFKPLLQPGNATWEAMWRAKAGFVPPSRRAAQPAPAAAGNGAHATVAAHLDKPAGGALGRHANGSLRERPLPQSNEPQPDQARANQ
jgi:putative copper resistance protein D